jgi:ankyrin repeat protein
MHDAARFGHAGICKALIEKGASTDLKNAKGLTPRGVALEHGHQEVINVLKDCGAKL